MKVYYLYCLAVILKGANAISLSLTPLRAEIHENEGLKLNCSLSEERKLVKWTSTNHTSVAVIGFSKSKCSANQFLNNSLLYEWRCHKHWFSLTIKNVKLSQHGEKWVCFLGKGDVSSNNSTIFVLVRVSKVTLDSPNSTSVTVAENTTLHFKCTTSESRPAPTVSWYIAADTAVTNNDVLISQGVTQIPAAGSKGYVATIGSLTYKPPRAANNKYVYCKSVDNDGYTVMPDRKTLLNITYKPNKGPLIQSFFNNTEYYAIDNKEQKLTCTVIGGNPLASLSWTCFTGTDDGGSNSGQNVSKLWTWKTSSNGTCVCTSTHLDVAEIVLLNVRILSPPTSPVFLLHSKIVQGSEAKIIHDSRTPITCSATSSPPPKYTWKYDRQSAALSQVAPLYPSSITVDGWYRCQVGNTMTPSQGQVEYGNSSASVYIQRLFPPTKPVLRYSKESGAVLSRSFKVVKGDNFDMHCSSTGNPSPSYRWTGDGHNVQNQVIALSSITLDRVYTCEVRNTMDPTFLSTVVGSSSSTVSVSVLSPPTNPMKTYQYSQSGSTSVTTTLNVIKGKSFNVTCAATALPAPTLSWTGPKNSSSGTLMFTSIQESHDGIYNCRARNIMNRTFGSQEIGTSATSQQIHVLYAPAVNPLNVDPIVEESTLSVECKTTPGNPARTTYSWKRKLNSSSDDTWQDITGFSVNRSLLHKTNIKRNDAGTYKCTASNVMKPTAGEEQTGSHSQTFILNVLYKTSISSFIEVNHLETQDVTVAENSSVTLQCKVDSNPYSTVSILKDGETKVSEGNTKQISYPYSKVACNTAGIYSCVGYNEYNTEESKPLKDLRLFVTCSPRLPSPEDFVSNITSALNDKAQLKITVLAYPVPKKSDFVWSRWNKDEWETLTNDKNVKINTSGLDSSLIFQNVKVSDYRKYKVNINNSFGQLQQEFFLNPYGKPNPPKNVNVMDGSLRETSVKITWTPGFDGGPKQTFVIQYKKQGESIWLEVTKEDEGTESMNVSLTGLVHGTTYIFQMYSKNREGNSSFTDILTFQTVEKTETTSTAALIGGATGGSLGFIILLIGVVVLFVRRSSFKKGKSKASSEGNDRKPVYEEENDYGMQDNPMYVSAGPRQSTSKAGESSSGGAAVYSTVNKRTKAIDNDNDNEYAVVNKTNKAKAKQGKKQKEKCKQGFFKDKKGKKIVQEGDIYENAPSKDVKAVPAKDETIYENPESSLSTQKKNVNKDGLIYADLTFNDPPKGQKKLVIHGLDSMTEYVQVDFTKKADPLPDSDDENVPPKN